MIPAAANSAGKRFSVIKAKQSKWESQLLGLLPGLPLAHSHALGNSP